MAEKKITIPENVNEFLSKASELCGKAVAEDFDQDLFHQITDKEMASPIEQLFFIAVNAICKGDGLLVNPEPFEVAGGTYRFEYGVNVACQAQIGRYRADFLVGLARPAKVQPYAPVVVELDGHDFHDQDKRQRSYEKARDRFFQKQGYRVVHFTGSDVVANPLRVAFEVLQMLGVVGEEDGALEDFSSEDPFSRGW